MNKEWKQQANIAAANVLGYYGEGAEPECGGTVAIFIDENGVLTWEPVRYLTIFGDSIEAKAAREDVVRVLGEEHGIYIAFAWVGAGKSWAVFSESDDVLGFGFVAYEEAVGAACVEVMK